MPLPPPPAAGLMIRGSPAVARRARQVREILLLACVPGQHRHAGRLHARLGEDLGAHGGDALRRGTDEHESGLRARLRELRRSRKESRSPDGSPPRRWRAPRPGCGRRRDSSRAPAPVRVRSASSASRTWRAVASASEYTAIVRIPRRRAVRKMRQAISPRLATRRLLIRTPSSPTSGTRRSASAPGVRCAPPPAPVPVRGAYPADR